MKDRRMNNRKLINTGLVFGLYMYIAPVFAETVIIEVKDSKFGEQQPLTIKAGTTVRWLNVEKRQYHSVWFEAEGLPEGDYFFPEETWERTFDKPGTYPYRCGPHDDMTGTIIVE